MKLVTVLAWHSSPRRDKVKMLAVLKGLESVVVVVTGVGVMIMSVTVETAGVVVTVEVETEPEMVVVAVQDGEVVGQSIWVPLDVLVIVFVVHVSYVEVTVAVWHEAYG